MQITSIEPIVWKVLTASQANLKCVCCHGDSGLMATSFIRGRFNGDYYREDFKIPACEKCREYASKYPHWLEEVIYLRKLKDFKAA